jgi:4-azaleucine resistance transporter AzlC
MKISPQSESFKEFFSGFQDTFPLVVGAIPFGIIFGALAVNSGLSTAGTMAMSAFVFAGSAQFIATSLISSGVGITMIILTTFVVNLRHALYGATLGPHLKYLPQRWLVPLGFWLTDESFVVTATRFNRPDQSSFKHWYFFGSSIFMYSNWQLCTFIGVKAGQAIPEPGNWGLDFAMIVTFIGLLVPMLNGKPVVIASLVAGFTAVIGYSLPNRLGLLVATLMGIIAGVLAEYWTHTPDLTGPDHEAGKP